MAKTKKESIKLGQLLQNCWHQYRHHWLLYLKLGLLAAFISTLFTQGSASGDTLVQFWSVLVFSGLLWTAQVLDETKPAQLKARTILYDGSASFLKQILIVIVWLFSMLPFLIGAGIFERINQLEFGAGTAEIILAYGIWLLLGILSIYWLLRSLFAPLLALKQTPLAALRGSWVVTKNRTLRLGLYAVVVILLASLPLVVLKAFPVPLSANLWLVLAQGVAFELLIFAVTLPFITLAMQQLHEYEHRQKPRRKTTR